MPTKKHILSIDDEADIRELLQEVLTIKGYRVSTAAEPEQAQKKVSSYLDKTASLSTIVAEIQRLLGDAPSSPEHS